MHMKRIFLLVVILLCGISVYAQKTEEECSCNSAAFIDIEYKGPIPLYDKPDGKVITYMKHDFANESFIHFEITKKKGKMIHIKAYTIDLVYPHGWINIDSHIGIYSRAYNGGLKLYSSPNDKSAVQSIIQEYDPEMYTVIDCQGEWLKVKRILHGKTYMGWMSPDMQCPNVYSTCS